MHELVEMRAHTHTRTHARTLVERLEQDKHKEASFTAEELLN